MPPLTLRSNRLCLSAGAARSAAVCHSLEEAAKEGKMPDAALLELLRSNSHRYDISHEHIRFGEGARSQRLRK